MADHTSSPSKTRRTKVCILIGIVAIVAVVSGLGFVFLNPQSFAVTISSVPAGGGFIMVDGNAIVTPCSFSWRSGSQHNITAASRISGSGVQYAYASWSDGGIQSHMITVNGTTNYDAAYLAVMPLTYTYAVGEQMRYNLTIGSNTMTGGTERSLNETGNLTLNVLSFDGENYTINETLATELANMYPVSPVYTYSETLVVNRTGYLVSVNGNSTFTQKLSSWLSNFVSAFERSEAESGDTWQIPLSSLYSNLKDVYPSNATLVLGGNMTETFGSLQNLTVLAGTYRVFNVDLSGSNLTVAANVPSMSMTFSENMTAYGRAYLEYGTNRMIETTTEMNSTTNQNGLIIQQEANEHMELVTDITH